LPEQAKQARTTLVQAVGALTVEWTQNKRENLLTELLDLNLPGGFYAKEVQALTGSPWQKTRLWDDDTTAIVHRLGKVKAHELMTAKPGSFTGTKWASLTRSERKAASNKRSRFETAPEGVFKTGKPAPLAELIEHYISIIEKHTGKDFGISRGIKKPHGKRLSVLMAALNRACFASTPPSVDTVVHILRNRKKA